MKTKSLINTNPYLKDPAKREMLIARSVSTSGGVEGIKPIEDDELPGIKIIHRKDKKIYKLLKKTAPAKS